MLSNIPDAEFTASSAAYGSQADFARILDLSIFARNSFSTGRLFKVKLFKFNF